MSKRSVIVTIVVVAVVAGVGGLGYRKWSQSRAEALPEGIAGANGRIEVERVDIAAKQAGRLSEILVREGDWLAKGATVAVMDQTEIRAQLAAAKAQEQRALSGIARAQAEAAARAADLDLAEVELKRSTDLLDRSVNSQAEVDRRRAQRNVAAAAVNAAKAAVGDAEAARAVAQAQVRQIEATIDDMTLRAPVAGRVEYRLVQPGEVIGAGGRIATLLDLSDVYMTIFLPTQFAGRVKLGSDARIVLDHIRDYVIPAQVSFVAAEAQFTPKAVETANEREKLMYRIKVRIDQRLLEKYRDYVKAGLTGMAYVPVGPNPAPWPERLNVRLPDGP